MMIQIKMYKKYREKTILKFRREIREENIVVNYTLRGDLKSCEWIRC